MFLSQQHYQRFFYEFSPALELWQSIHAHFLLIEPQPLTFFHLNWSKFLHNFYFACALNDQQHCNNYVNFFWWILPSSGVVALYSWPFCFDSPNPLHLFTSTVQNSYIVLTLFVLSMTNSIATCQHSFEKLFPAVELWQSIHGHFVLIEPQSLAFFHLHWLNSFIVCFCSQWFYDVTKGFYRLEMWELLNLNWVALDVSLITTRCLGKEPGMNIDQTQESSRNWAFIRHIKIIIISLLPAFGVSWWGFLIRSALAFCLVFFPKMIKNNDSKF